MDTKIWYALNWSMQHLYGAHILKLRFNRWRSYRRRQPAGPAGGGATLVALVRCSMSCSGQLWRPGGILFHKIHCGITFIDKDKFLTPSQKIRPGLHTTHSIAGPRLIVMPRSILFSQGLFTIGIVWLQLWSQQRPQRSSGYSF